MSGYLYNLRKNWRIHTADPAKTMDTPAMAFIRLFGATAKFRHAGLDCDYGASGKRHYHAQMYAVFAPNDKADGPLIPMTLNDVESLILAVKGLAPIYPNRDAIFKNMSSELDLATRTMASYQKTVQELNPYSAPRQQLA
jgi:hypothetical protein